MVTGIGGTRVVPRATVSRQAVSPCKCSVPWVLGMAAMGRGTSTLHHHLPSASACARWGGEGGGWGRITGMSGIHFFLFFSQ